MHTIQKSFNRAVHWSAIESIYYRILYSAHTFLLFSIIDTQTFGFIGTLFSSVYFLINVFNFALSSSFAPFFKQVTANKASFNYFLYQQIIIHLLMGGSVLIVSTLAYSLYTVPTISSSLLAASFFITFICEGFKRIAKTILHLALSYKAPIISETFCITSFFIITWSTYLLTGMLNAETVFCAMGFSSFLSVFFLVPALINFYNDLPENKIEKYKTISLIRLLKTRIYLYLHTFSSTVLFSSNFLVPLIALYAGYEYVSVFKLVSNVTHSISVVIYHAFHSPSLAYLSQVHAEKSNEKKEAFKHATNKLYQILLAISIFVLINYKTIFSMHKHATLYDPIALIIFFIILFTENFFITYRSLCITSEQIAALLACSLAPLFGFYLLNHSGFAFSITTFLTTLIIARLFSFGCLVAFGFHKWRITPSLTIDSRKIAAFAAFTGACRIALERLV